MSSPSSRSPDIHLYSVHPASLRRSYECDIHLSSRQLRDLYLDDSRHIEATSIPVSVTRRLSTSRPCTAFTRSERCQLRLSDSLSLRQEGSAAHVGCSTFQPDRYASTLYDLRTARPLPPLPFPVDKSFTDHSLPFFPRGVSDHDPSFNGRQSLGLRHSVNSKDSFTNLPLGIYGSADTISYEKTQWWQSCAQQPAAVIHTHPFLRRSLD
eukprot:GHVS01054465.1.p1 GENE.GHVS01054465.1~~GHVS01054465.1.p1  ORF type:complete len:223 (-),score=11.44 GHVS01054465.1:111-740(-)